MRFITPTCLILIAFSAHGRTNHETFRELARAKSAAEIRRIVTAIENLKIARIACRLQLKQKNVPLACYESLHLEIKKGLHPNPAKRVQIASRLDELCVESAQSFKIPRNLPPFLAVSSKCRKNIAESQKIRKYREQSLGWSEN